jgi:hypothetical protein
MNKIAIDITKAITPPSAQDCKPAPRGLQQPQLVRNNYIYIYILLITGNITNITKNSVTGVIFLGSHTTLNLMCTTCNLF